MAKTMKAAVIHTFGAPLEIREIEKPEARLGQVVVRNEACDVCHTDLHAAIDDAPVKPAPLFIPGHEGVVVTAVLSRSFSQWASSFVGKRCRLSGCRPVDSSFRSFVWCWPEKPCAGALSAHEAIWPRRLLSPQKGK